VSNLLVNLRRTVALSGGRAAIAQVLLANVLILAINLGTGVITARLLGPTGRGEQAAMAMWPQLVGTALTLGLPSAFLYNLKRRSDRAPQLLSAALLLGTSMGLLATLVGILFIPYWLTEYSPEVVRTAQWLMLFAPMSLINLVILPAFLVREEFGTYNAVRFLIPLLTLLTLVSLAFSHNLTPYSAALAYALPLAPVTLWMLARLWRLYRPVWRGLGSDFKSLTSYGLRSYGLDLLGPHVAGQLDRALVVGLLDPAAMGLYVVAVSSSQVLSVIQTAVVTVLFPKASGRPLEEVVAMIGQGARVSIVMTLLAAVCFAFLGPWVLGLVYGQEFLGAVTVFRILLLNVALGSMAYVLAYAFMALDRPGTMSLMNAIGRGLSVPLLLVLVPRYGLEGAGLSILLSTVAELAFVIISYPLLLKTRVPRLWPKRADFTGAPFDWER
jgi:O-antigen/teichoic acid export membrane protein